MGQLVHSCGNGSQRNRTRIAAKFALCVPSSASQTLYWHPPWMPRSALCPLHGHRGSSRRTRRQIARHQLRCAHSSPHLANTCETLGHPKHAPDRASSLSRRSLDIPRKTSRWAVLTFSKSDFDDLTIPAPIRLGWKRWGTLWTATSFQLQWFIMLWSKCFVYQNVLILLGVPYWSLHWFSVLEKAGVVKRPEGGFNVEDFVDVTVVKLSW